MGPADSARFFERALGLAFVTLLLLACLRIAWPFVTAILWAVTIAVSVWPWYVRLTQRMRGRRTAAAVTMTLALAIALLLPIALTFASIAESVGSGSGATEALASVKIPPAPERLRAIPIVGAPIHEAWASASSDPGSAFGKFGSLAKSAGQWLLDQTLDLGLSFLQFLLAVVITAPMLIGGVGGGATMRRLAVRLGGERSVPLLEVAARTIRGVSFGVIGTALLQGVLMVIGLAVAGVPGLALLGFASFLLAVLQIGVFPVWLGAAWWLAHQDHDGWAIFILVWGVVISVMDNFVKPYLISHGSGTPLTVIFVGVLGGLMAWGFIGIFVGPTLLAVGYTLFRSWLEQEAAESGNAADTR